MRVVGKLSAARVTALVKAGKPGLYGDGAGLGLRITRTGNASWAFRYMRDGTAHEAGLGPVHTFGLAEARERARRFRQQLAEGIDPIAQRQAQRRGAARAVSFATVAEMYLASHTPAWRSPVHIQQWKATLRDYILPALGDLAVAEIDTGAVLRVLEPIWHSKPETASRVRGRTEMILDFASARGWRTGENPARWRGHLDHLLPAPAKVKPVKHHAALPWQEIGEVIAQLGRRQGVAALAVRFLILTAARSGEVRDARWSEIDLNSATWIVPAARMKGGKEHRVPLSDGALAILREVEPLRQRPGDLVFPGQRPGSPLSDVGLSKLLPPGGTIHGMRSTFRDWAGETTAYPREVIEMALAHRIGDKAEQAYARGDLFQRRRALMEAWAAHCAGSAPGGEVALTGKEAAARAA